MRAFFISFHKKITPLLLMTAAVSLAGADKSPATQPTTQPTTQPAALKTLESVQGCFKVEYPASWKCTSSGSLKTIPKSASEAETEFTGAVLPSPIAPDENDASVDALVHAARSQGEKIDSDEHILLDGAPAREVTLTSTDKIFETKAVLIFTIRNNKQYKITYSGAPDSVKMHRDEVDAIIKSWNWTDSGK